MSTFPIGSPAHRKQEDPLGLLPTMPQQISGIFCIFTQSTVLLNIIKNPRHSRKILKPSTVLLFFWLFPTIPPFANLKQERQSL
jgi:hypothetical protein